MNRKNLENKVLMEAAKCQTEAFENVCRGVSEDYFKGHMPLEQYKDELGEVIVKYIDFLDGLKEAKK